MERHTSSGSIAPFSIPNPVSYGTLAFCYKGRVALLKTPFGIFNARTRVVFRAIFRYACIKGPLACWFTSLYLMSTLWEEVVYICGAL